MLPKDYLVFSSTYLGTTLNVLVICKIQNKDLQLSTLKQSKSRNSKTPSDNINIIVNVLCLIRSNSNFKIGFVLNNINTIMRAKNNWLTECRQLSFMQCKPLIGNNMFRAKNLCVKLFSNMFANRKRLIHAHMSMISLTVTT